MEKENSLTGSVTKWCSRACSHSSECPLLQAREDMQNRSVVRSDLWENTHSWLQHVKVRGSTLLCRVKNAKGVLIINDIDLSI